MDVIYNSMNTVNNDSGIGLGTFDGLHTGHLVLVDALKNECDKRGLNSIIYTFDEHPDNVLTKRIKTPILSTVKQKETILRERDIDHLVIDKFNESYAKMDPETFVRDVLVGRLKMKLAVAGFNYTFGYKGIGDVSLLKELSIKYGFEFIEIPTIIIDDEIVSSTLIRNYIGMGDVEKASKLLGRTFSLSGTVEKGKQLGSKMGFPTANIYPEPTFMLPSRGVYITVSCINGVKYNSITNVGINPTFKENKGMRLETHIFDFNCEIYGTYIELFFIKKMRDEIKFNDKEQLSAQVHNDIETARKHFNT